MSAFKIEFEMDNAAFDPEYRREEVARILAGVASRIEGDRWYGPVLDSNGNRVGEYSATFDH